MQMLQFNWHKKERLLCIVFSLYFRFQFVLFFVALYSASLYFCIFASCCFVFLYFCIFISFCQRIPQMLYFCISISVFLWFLKKIVRNLHLKSLTVSKCALFSLSVPISHFIKTSIPSLISASPLNRVSFIFHTYPRLGVGDATKDKIYFLRYVWIIPTINLQDIKLRYVWKTKKILRWYLVKLLWLVLIEGGKLQW